MQKVYCTKEGWCVNIQRNYHFYLYKQLGKLIEQQNEEYDSFLNSSRVL